MRRLTLTTTDAHRGMRLDEALAAWLPGALGRPLSRSALRRLVMVGAVRVGGRPVRRPGQPLSVGARLEAAIDLERLPVSDPGTPALLTEAQVLYEDGALLALDKPPGLPMHPTADPRRRHFYGLAKELLARRGGGEEPRLGLHHRLDRDTSGVVLFTKDPAADAPLAALFAGRGVAKTYHALTRRPVRLPAPAWRVADRLAATGRRGRPVARDEGGQDAETEFALVEAFPGGLLVEARPITGRKHQIRVHLADAGLPILGDAVYGGSGEGGGSLAPRLMLHALRLALPHPLSGAPLVIESPYPDDFRRVVESLRRARGAERAGTHRR